jgi:hypothetical protein
MQGLRSFSRVDEVNFTGICEKMQAVGKKGSKEAHLLPLVL